MKKLGIRKISFLLAVLMVCSLCLPLLASASSYFKFNYDSSTGDVSGIFYSDSSDVTARVYGGTDSFDLTPLLKQQEANGVYRYDLKGRIGLGRGLERISINDGTERTQDLDVKNYGYAYQDKLAAPELDEFTLHWFDQGDQTGKFMFFWKEAQQVGVSGYKVYLNGNPVKVTDASDPFAVISVPEGEVFSYSVSAVDLFGIDSAKSEEATSKSPDFMHNVKLNLGDKPTSYAFGKGEELLTFSPDYSTVGAGFKLQMTLEGYELDSDSISLEDFELVYPDGTVELPSEFDQIEDQLTFSFTQNLEEGRDYTLKLSDDADGDEITTSSTNMFGFINLELMNSSDQLINQYIDYRLAIGDPYAPEKPANFKAVPYDASIFVSWDANQESDLAEYRVYLDDVLKAALPVTKTTYYIEGLTNDQRYSVNVAAVDKAGNETRQTKINVTPKAGLGTPDDGTPGDGTPGDGTPGDGTPGDGTPGGGTPGGGTPGGGTPGGGFPGGGFGGIMIPPVQQGSPGTKVVDESSLKNEQGTVVVTLGNDDNKVLLPASAAVLAKGIVLSLESEQFRMQIPGEVLEKLKSLVSAEDLKDAKISFGFDKLEASKAQALLSEAGKQTGAAVKRAGDIYDFALGIVKKDGSEQKLTYFDQPLTLTFHKASGVNADLSGIYHIADNGKVEYIRSTAKDGKVTASISHFSKYAVLEISKSFTDVPAGHWAGQAIAKMAAQQVISGISANAFGPNKQVTRAEFAAFLTRKLNLKAAGTSQFTDVTTDKWYADEVTAAAEAGLVAGKAEGKFAPDAKVTREEIIVMLVKAYELSSGSKADLSASPAFADSERIAGWAKGYVAAAAKLGFIQGRGDGAFVPQGTAVRAEAALLVSKL
ncbi:S-layer homology domain-containing protein [Paenibacillus gansuensis]|uniref:S-layer homology domain-containing protein n=1 Tax=Paenibacillus gansuensis TaxID=306542 RepID=A0ABW5PFY9_9BACL